jgi:hypothetical protein
MSEPEHVGVVMRDAIREIEATQAERKQMRQDPAWQLVRKREIEQAIADLDAPIEDNERVVDELLGRWIDGTDIDDILLLVAMQQPQKPTT